MSDVEIEVLITPGCHLCSSAIAVTAAACAEAGLSYREVNISDSPQLLAQFSEEVPVLRINGQVRDFWVFDPVRLRGLLQEALSAGM